MESLHLSAIALKGCGSRWRWGAFSQALLCATEKRKHFGVAYQLSGTAKFFSGIVGESITRALLIWSYEDFA
jgi:hypothetical protein